MTDKNNQQKTPNQIADQLADSIWKITAEWDDFAKSSVGVPLGHAVDSVGLHLAMSLGQKSVKEHLQHIANARKNLTPASYWLQRALSRGLIEQDKAKQLAEQMEYLAKRLDQHAQTVIKATNEKIAEQQKQKKTNLNAEASTKADTAAEQAVAH